MKPNRVTPIVYQLAVLPLLVAPWLNPFTSGPNAAVLPFLFAWACTSLALLVWAVIDLTPQQRIRTMAMAWLVAAGVNALLGLLQYFDISQHWSPWVNQPGMGQAFGNLRQRNQFSTLCSMGLAALGWWVVQPACFARRRRAGTLLAAALALLLVTAVAASGSRTGMLQLVLLAMLGACWLHADKTPHVPRKKGLVLVAAIPLVYLLAAQVLPYAIGVTHGALERWPETAAQCNSRLNLWRNVLYLIAQKPLWGWGWGELGYAHFITLFDAPWAGLRFCELLDNAHNLPLHLAVELGVPTALFLCGVAGVWVWRRRPLQEQRPDRQLAWAVLTVIGVHSLLEYPLWYAQFQVAALFCVGLVHRCNGGAALVHEAATRARPWGRPALVAGVFIGMLCALASWSYWRVSQPYLPPEQRAPLFREQSWAQMREVLMFRDQVDFAQLAVTPVTPANAAYLQSLATDVLHFSPEPMVVQKLLQSAQMQGKDADVAFYAKRFEAAYPADYGNWATSRP